MVPAIEAVHCPYTRDWGKSYRRRSVIWGEHYNKQIRTFIRREVENELRNFFKLIGMRERIVVNKVNFEK